jgi:hypothetical protein
MGGLKGQNSNIHSSMLSMGWPYNSGTHNGDKSYIFAVVRMVIRDLS